MPSFGGASQAKLITCHRDIVRVCTEVIKRVDFSVIEGARSDERQLKLFKQGRSTLDGINDFSKHQLVGGQTHSNAVDLLPYPAVVNGINIWKDEFRFAVFAGEVIGIGWSLGIDIRWGGDWDGDGSREDQSFHDLPHFELG